MLLLLRNLIGKMLMKVYPVDIIELFENILIDKNFVSDLIYFDDLYLNFCFAVLCKYFVLDSSRIFFELKIFSPPWV